MKTLHDIRYSIAHHFMGVTGDNSAKIADLEELIEEIQFYIKALKLRQNSLKD